MITKHFLFTEVECKEYISLIESLNSFKKAELGNYYYVELDNTFPGYEKIKDWCNSKLKFKSKGWLQCFKYLSGNSFPLHTDRSSKYEYSKDSLFNVNIVLNNDYVGGEFYTNGVYYKNEPGLIYYYPSTQPHGVTEIKKGTRYVLLYTIREREIQKDINKRLL